MKTLTLLVAVLAAAGCVGHVAGDPVDGEPCPKVCPYNILPVCAIQWGDRFQTFDNDCERRAHNCRTQDAFEFVCRGTCVYGPEDVTPAKSRAGFLPASVLCNKQVVDQ